MPGVSPIATHPIASEDVIVPQLPPRIMVINPLLPFHWLEV